MKQIENRILVLLWSLSLCTYSIVLLGNYAFFPSNYIGLAGLVIVTIIFFIKPGKKTLALLVLLFFGTFNLASFVYFFDPVIIWGNVSFITPGIQILSLVCLGILTYTRRSQVIARLQGVSGTTNEDRQNAFERQKDRFKIKFENLDPSELELKLSNDLQPEAKQAVTELMEQRKMHYNKA